MAKQWTQLCWLKVRVVGGSGCR